MKISVIIPTHRKEFLQECLDSVYRQTYTDYEIVLVPTNGIVLDGIILNDKVREVRMPTPSNKVGEIKNFAFHEGLGEVLLELDSDDILVETALEEVAKAFENSEIGFVYSNFAEFNSDGWGVRPPYGAEYGWESRKFSWQGHELNEMIAFKPSPQAVSLVWYSPNHLRAWRRSVYLELGGHNKELPICDDQELIARTYLVTKFKHINQCLYLYRVHGENTWLKYNADIQAKTWEVYCDYIEKLCLKWSKDSGLKALDICGGFNPPEGFVSVDKFNGDIITDLDDPWPFEDGSVGVIRAHDALEHLHKKQFTMSEIYRVPAPGGMLLSSTPSTDGRGAFQDPTHVSYWNENSFWYYTRKEQAQYIRNDKERFMVNRLTTWFPSDWHEKNKICYVNAELTKLTDDMPRLPGIIEI